MPSFRVIGVRHVGFVHTVEAESQAEAPDEPQPGPAFSRVSFHHGDLEEVP